MRTATTQATKKETQANDAITKLLEQLVLVQVRQVADPQGRHGEPAASKAAPAKKGGLWRQCTRRSTVPILIDMRYRAISHPILSPSLRLSVFSSSPVPTLSHLPLSLSPSLSHSRSHSLSRSVVQRSEVPDKCIRNGMLCEVPEAMTEVVLTSPHKCWINK
jgi:hypothetical protein